MIRKNSAYLLIVLCLCVSCLSNAQNTYTGLVYRSGENPFYWKNRVPVDGYWQQDVDYAIEAVIDEQKNTVSGKMVLNYFNNSPDTLRFVYFHLYQNAFQPGSYMDNLYRNNNYPVKYGKYESQKLGITLENFEVLMTNNKDESYRPEMIYDNTLVRINLKDPLLPGASMRFSSSFTTYFDNGNIRRRMKMFAASGYKHFDGVHWYPRMAVYDRRFGWDTNQHLGKEFYGDFGSYDVHLTFANNYIVEATGELVNRKEMLPDTLRQKLDISNFAHKPLNSAASVIIAPDGSVKTWHFRAMNVHDFAWTADPTYRIGEAEWNGVQCIALAQEPVAARWQNAASYTANIIEANSQVAGMYGWPKIVVADAMDGMEYPMLTLDGGTDPGYRSLFCHEVSHMWFFGMVGNNETYRAFLDEGFAQFLNSTSITKIEGDSTDNSSRYNWYKSKFVLPVAWRYEIVYQNYIREAIKNEDGFLNTHSDGFNGALGHGGGYSQVYRKTATMLYNLQYVLGDELFSQALKHYFDQWKMCHPYPEDFRSSFISFTHVDLNWFFDQWLETDKTIDYKVAGVKKVEKDVYNITFKREGRMQMPLDFSVTGKDGSRHSYYIPNTWFHKKTEAVVLPKWEGWDKLNPSYTATVTVPGGIADVAIDTTYRLADINLVNNRKKKPVTLRFDSRIYNPPQWQEYEVKARPDLWYNNYDGIKAGIHMEGSYMNYRDIFNLDIWLNTGIAQSHLSEFAVANQFDQVSIAFDYTTPLKHVNKNAFIKLDARYLDGLIAYSGTFEQYTRSKKYRFFTTFKSMYRQNTSDLEYLLYPDQWHSALFNNTIQVGLGHTWSGNTWNAKSELSMRSSAVGSDYDFAAITFSHTGNKAIWKFDLRTRLFAQYASGSNMPLESSLYLAGANEEDMMENKFVRAAGWVPDNWRGYGADVNHFHFGGGLNLRGYAGYAATEEDNHDSIRLIYRGQSGAAINAELDLDRLVSLQPGLTRKWLHIDVYLFGDAGTINYSTEAEDLRLSEIRGDAGAGIALTIKKFGPLEMVQPLVLRFDMPLYLSNAPAASPDNFSFRYVVGVNRAF
jgi:hypothetical protein